MISRCVNIDWLECYCHEDMLGYPHNAEHFRELGFHVVEREYGTPVYHEMFVLYGTDDQPLLEIRRNPKSAQGRQLHGVLDPLSCHVRLSNRTCYFKAPAVLMQQFLEQYGFHFQRISRIDIALDFERFDYGDDPQDVLRRYMSGKYAKINQANLSAHGRDLWDGRDWNSLKWGQEKSMVSTKFYNKTLEITQKTDKPYIRQSWQAAGLVSDYHTLELRHEDGTITYPQIWRVEFSIKSSTRKWFVIEDNNGQKRKIQSIPHTLDMYHTHAQLLQMFFSLAHHYFHFKKFQKGVRKDRCEDKLLFRTTEQPIFYKLENIAVKEPADKLTLRLIAYITQYRDTHVTPEIFRACNVLLKQLEFERRTQAMTYPWPSDELTACRLLISRMFREHSQPKANDLSELRDLIKLNNDLFGEVDE